MGYPALKPLMLGLEWWQWRKKARQQLSMASITYTQRQGLAAYRGFFQEDGRGNAGRGRVSQPLTICVTFFFLFLFYFFFDFPFLPAPWFVVIDKE